MPQAELLEAELRVAVGGPQGAPAPQAVVPVLWVLVWEVRPYSCSHLEAPTTQV